MKETEIVKQYLDRIMTVVNKIRLFGDHFSDNRIVEKVIITFPERYESKVSSLKDSRDLSTIYLSELINALYAQEQRRASKQEKHSKVPFQARSKGETMERRSIHLVLIIKKVLTWRIIVGSGLTYNVEPINILVT
ncbi:hypothetical protein PVK06_049142 [Gossypium arboreum]|uniref:Uncharacterized protein n=1 Tax=Gossypium arboreum TaxID=29729 RepID=A0ABR0MHX2_GOSAR|nr:hypothetical protein PVK06_049142 [Gossypium arboreum]